MDMLRFHKFTIGLFGSVVSGSLFKCMSLIDVEVLQVMLGPQIMVAQKRRKSFTG